MDCNPQVNISSGDPKHIRSVSRKYKEETHTSSIAFRGDLGDKREIGGSLLACAFSHHFRVIYERLLLVIGRLSERIKMQIRTWTRKYIQSISSGRRAQ